MEEEEVWGEEGGDGGREGEGKKVRPRTLSVEWRAVGGCVDRAYRAYLLSTYPCVSREIWKDSLHASLCCIGRHCGMLSTHPIDHPIFQVPSGAKVSYITKYGTEYLSRGLDCPLAGLQRHLSGCWNRLVLGSIHLVSRPQRRLAVASGPRVSAAKPLWVSDPRVDFRSKQRG